MKEKKNNTVCELKKNECGKKTKEKDLFVIKNENISFYSQLNSDEKVLNIRLFNPKSSLQSTEIEFEIPVKKAEKIKHSKFVIGEVDVNDKSILISLRPKEILTVSLSI